MNRFAERTGRRYHLFDYFGAEDADRVIVLMGSGVGAVREAVEALNARGEKVGGVAVRLFRPFAADAFINALPLTTRRIAVLDRTKEPGAMGEPLYQEALTSIVERWSELRSANGLPKVIGGRYGLSSKEFTPAMASAVFDQLRQERPKNHFTIGINDDVTHKSIPWDSSFHTEHSKSTRAVFYGLGSDGTVGATKNTVKIVGENTSLFAQGYFVYDSRKSGAVTVSHLRVSPKPIHSSYLIQQANFVACHQFNFLERMDVLSAAEQGATFLLNSPHAATEIWAHLPQETQQQILDKQLQFFVVDANTVAREAGLGNRINTVMQACFFKLSGMLPEEQAIAEIKKAIEKSYGKRGETILRRNYDAVDAAIAAIAAVPVPKEANSSRRRIMPVPEHAPDFVQRVTAMILAGLGDALPVSALPVDGTFPTSSAKWEKRSIAHEVPVWDEEICTECGLCALVCPHAAIRTKAYEAQFLDSAPGQFQSRVGKGKNQPERRYTVQVAPDDCTGCGVCVDVCPARSKEEVKHKAINMTVKEEDLLNRQRENFGFFLGLPHLERDTVDFRTVKGSQQLEPLFEYSGACAGCGETPYLKLLTQLFGDRMVIANATGCSSIYGGNLPTTPWSTNQAGEGPAWANSLFEDNAEFGLGMRLALSQQRHIARQLLEEMRSDLDPMLVDGLLAEGPNPDASEERDRLSRQRREWVSGLKRRLGELQHPKAQALLSVADALVERSVWIIGGDGWAYDIGFGGLDHVLASGENVNILVLDTEVYSNTGGQASKATPRAAVAKFASSGKTVGKKDLGMIAAAYGNVYVAQVAMGANPRQTIRALLEAEAYPGPSLTIAYSTCIAHGIDMATSMSHQKEAVSSGYWPLYRFVPHHEAGKVPFHLDSRKPTLSFKEFAAKEARFAMLMRSDPQQAAHLAALAQRDIDERWRYYEQLAGIERSVPQTEETRA